MKTIKYQIKLQGLKTAPGSISIYALKDLSSILVENTERALRLAVEGYSLKKGQPPKWLKDAVNFNITKLSKGSTLIDIEAPELSEVAADQIEQQNLWIAVPKPQDTALTIWANSFNKAIAEDTESDIYDRDLLNSFYGFNEFIEKYSATIEINSNQDRRISRMSINEKELSKIKRLTSTIPESRKIILSAKIDVIEHKNGRFKLNLENGETIQGEIDRQLLDLEIMRDHWGKKVTVRGIADFKANGKMRFIKADMLKPFDDYEKPFEDYLIYEEPKEIVHHIIKEKPKVSPLQEIWGKWPSDESIEQILDELD